MFGLQQPVVWHGLLASPMETDLAVGYCPNVSFVCLSRTATSGNCMRNVVQQGLLLVQTSPDVLERALLFMKCCLEMVGQLLKLVEPWQAWPALLVHDSEALTGHPPQPAWPAHDSNAHVGGC